MKWFASSCRGRTTFIHYYIAIKKPYSNPTVRSLACEKACDHQSASLGPPILVEKTLAIKFLVSVGLCR